MVAVIQPMRVWRVPRLQGTTSTFLARASRTRVSPLGPFFISWMVMVETMSEIHQTAAATSGASESRW